MTSDDHIIYEDLASQEIYAVAAAGENQATSGR